MTAVIMLAGFFIVTLVVGLMPTILQRRKGTAMSANEYFLGGRGLGLLLIFFTLMATWYSSGVFLGSVAEVYTKGLEWVFGFTSSAIAAIVFLLLGPQIKRLGDRHGYVTQADMYADRFKSPAVGYISGLIGIVFIIPYITIQMVGTGYIIETFTDGLIPYWAGSLIGLLVCFVFIYAGGIRSVAWTDVFFGIIFLVSIWGVVLLVANNAFGGFGSMFSTLVDENSGLLTLPGPEGVSWTYFFSQAWVIGLGGYMWPHLFMRMFASASVKSIRRSGSLLIIASLVAQVPIVIGALAAANAFPGLDSPDTALLVLVGEYAPLWMVGILAVGGVAASLSTINSLIHSEGVLISNDIYAKITRKDASDRSVLKFTRLIITVLCVLVYLLSLTQPEYLWSIMAQAYGGVVQFFPVTIAALYWKRATKAGVLTGMSVGVVVSLFFSLGPIQTPLGVVAPAWGLLANVICLIAVSLGTSNVAPAVEKEKIA